MNNFLNRLKNGFIGIFQKEVYYDYSSFNPDQISHSFLKFDDSTAKVFLDKLIILNESKDLDDLELNISTKNGIKINSVDKLLIETRKIFENDLIENIEKFKEGKNKFQYFFEEQDIIPNAITIVGRIYDGAKNSGSLLYNLVLIKKSADGFWLWDMGD